MADGVVRRKVYWTTASPSLAETSATVRIGGSSLSWMVALALNWAGLAPEASRFKVKVSSGSSRRSSIRVTVSVAWV